MSRISVATVSSPEFINITSISPFAAKCEIKVLYLGQNRNGSAINKEVATQMAQTLPGTPIVGYYSEDKDDFRDHGDQVIIDGDGIKFKCQTVPYGFVAPDAKVWFKDFEDTDDFGNVVIRTYLMTEGYLWTEQYKEAQRIINESRPQSMELDTETLKGYWSTDANKGMDFYIITDAVFSKLCILGDDVEPCFEGASISAPDVSANFSLDEKFTNTLHSMLKELKELTFSLKDKGGNSMPENENIDVQQEETPVADDAQAEEAIVSEEGAFAEAENSENFSNAEDKNGLENNAENQNNTEEFKKSDDEDNKEDSDKADSESDDETEEDDDKEEDAKAKHSLDTESSIEEKYALLETQYNELQEKYTSLEQQNAELVQFKADVEDKEKDALISQFYMLSDEDKKEVIENKSNYSLDDIEAKLSVICVRKKVNFNLENNTDSKEDDPAVTFNFQGNEGSDLPPWLKAVEEHRIEE